MNEKKQKDAIILDTNFIIAYKSNNLKDKVNELSKIYDVYITQVSINERQSQKYLEYKEKYDNLENYKIEYNQYANIELKMDFDTYIKKQKEKSLSFYKKQFKEKIIDLNTDDYCLNIIIDRAYKKMPPFCTDKNSSDKGFKDTLIWFSILNYFTENKSNIEVVFLTDDNSFIKQVEALKKEFYELTGMNIEIRNNSYFNNLIGKENEKIIINNNFLSIPKNEIIEIRDEINKVIGNIIYNQVWGLENNFYINKKIDYDIMLQILNSLEQFLFDNIFNDSVYFSILLSPFQISVKDKYKISISEIEQLFILYKKISSKYNDFLTQFINTLSEKINVNYIEPIEFDEEEVELPF